MMGFGGQPQRPQTMPSIAEMQGTAQPQSEVPYAPVAQPPVDPFGDMPRIPAGLAQDGVPEVALLVKDGRMKYSELYYGTEDQRVGVQQTFIDYANEKRVSALMFLRAFEWYYEPKQILVKGGEADVPSHAPKSAPRKTTAKRRRRTQGAQATLDLGAEATDK